jgi:hypothetical protein
MKTSFLKSAWIVPVAALSLSGLVVAQDDQVDLGTPTPRFAVLPPKPAPDGVRPTVALPTWNFSFTYDGKSYTDIMVGSAPSANTSTTIQAFIIPVKLVVTVKGEKLAYDPSTVLTNGNTVTENTVDSPLFDSTTTYTQGGVNVGTTQYIDAYQRANFWGTVSTNPNSHMLLGGPTVLTEQTLNVPKKDGKTDKVFGVDAALVDINWFDDKVQTMLKKFTEIQPNTLPIFLIYDTYLTQAGQCCIGGYHTYNGTQAYAVASYVDVVGSFSQNVSALSHEIGEWTDDPLTNNNSPCGILEVGDPLEGLPNYGAYPYVLHGFTYDLQDLVTLPYFGAPPSTTVNDWFSFQGRSLTVCEHGS